MEPLSRLDASSLAGIMAVYRQALRLHQDALNALNVYPVPDGDTGTNMALTVESVVTELGKVDGVGPLPAAAPAPGDPDELVETPSTGVPAMAEVCRAVAHGSLMGARGNSGVILSQLLRGLTAQLADGDDVSGPTWARALSAASDAAAQAVLRPVEGTILSVARAAAEGAERCATDDAALVTVLEGARQAAADALARTPEQLPALAQAGVVDAGGAGYLLLLDSALCVLDGRALPPAPVFAAPVSRGAAEALPLAGFGTEVPGGHNDLRYEVMYFLEAPDHTIPAFKDVWAGLGDSIVVVGGEGLWNCHIHTNDVGGSIEAALDTGRPRDIRVTDLSDQVDEERWVREGAVVPGAAEDSGPVPRTAVVAIANGEGIGRIFRSLGVHFLVAGGQSMNPSTAEILAVVEAAPSPEVVLLPNNDNIHPVANQVCELATKTVRVVPTSGIVEGFAALLEYDPEAGAPENATTMAASARRVVAGEVTRAVRDATGSAGPIRAGDWLGLSRDGVEVVGESVVEATCGLLGKLLRDDHELVTLIEGDGAGAGETRRVTQWLSEHRPDVAVEVHHGGQPLYPYLVSIE